jgi:hypothetical protein
MCGKGLHRKPMWMSLELHKKIENRILYPLRDFICENDGSLLVNVLEPFQIMGFGLNCGFPIHCVLEYVIDNIFLNMRRRRWTDDNLSLLEDELGYRPCSRCLQRLNHEEPKEAKAYKALVS